MNTLSLRKILPLLFVAAVAILPSCWPWGKKDAAKLTGLVVINVLDKTLHDDCHIKGSINVTIDKIEQFAHNRIDKNTEIVLYCSNYICSSSGFVRGKLIGQGFENVLVYEGGIAQWHQLGYPTVGPAQSAYLKRVVQAPEKLEPYVIDAQTLKQKIETHEAQKS